MAGRKALLFLPGYGGIGCEILAAVRERRLSAENSHCPRRCLLVALRGHPTSSENWSL